MRDDRSLSPFAVALRQARLSRALSINDVVKAILLSDKQVLGLENDDYSYFYNMSYAATAAESYASFLGVDVRLEGAPSRDKQQPPRLVTSIDKTSTSAKPQRLFDSPRRPFIWFALIVLFLLVYVIRSCEDAEVTSQAIAVDEQSLQSRYLNEQAPLDETVSDASDISRSEAASVEWVPDVNEVATPAISAISNPKLQIPPKPEKNESLEWDRDAKENRFFIVINKQTWISARDSLNSSLMDGVQKPTTGRRVIGKKPFVVVLEDPNAVEIYYLKNRIRPGNSGNSGISVAVRRQGLP